MKEEKMAQGEPEQPVGQQTEPTNNPWTPPQASLAEASLSEEEQRLTGLGGWLILVGIGVTLYPIKLFFNLINTVQVLGLEQWAAQTTPGLETYIPFLATVVISELVVDMLFTMASIYTAILFFSQKKAFPRWFIGVFVAAPVFLLLDIMATSWVVNDNRIPYGSTLISQCIYIAVWVPYMLRSKRVRLTFVR